MLKLHYFYFLVVSTRQSIAPDSIYDYHSMLIIADNNPGFHMIFPKSADFTFLSNPYFLTRKQVLHAVDSDKQG